MDGCQVEPNRREKHLCILDEVNRLRVEINLLDGLGNKISSVDCKDTEKPSTGEDISLLEFLDQAPDMVANLSEKLVSIRASLSTMLF